MREWLRHRQRSGLAGGRLVIFLLLVVSLLTTQNSAAAPPIIQSPQFGIDFISAPGSTFSNQSQRYSSAAEAGAGWNRWVIYWSDVEPQCNKSYNWSGAD